MASNFEDVNALNQVFRIGNTTRNDTDWTQIESQLSLIEEEFNELKQAIADRNWNEIKDAVGDILVVTYGMGYRGNFDCDQLMKNISKSNFSKLCHTAEEVELTVSHYTNRGVKVMTEATELHGKRVWAVKSACDQTYFENGEERSIRSGKFLKNVNWTKPDLAVDYK